MSELTPLAVPVFLVGLNGIITGIGKFFEWLAEKWDELVYYRVVIKHTDNPRCKHAVLEELKKYNLHTEGSTIQMGDGFDNPECVVRNGSYKFESPVGTIHADISDSEIVLKATCVPGPRDMESIEPLKGFVEAVYREYNAPTKVMMFFTAQGDNWSHPICREPRKFDNITISASMQTVLTDIEYFYSPSGKKEYSDKGWAYRRGYFLWGNTGTGKSTMAEIVAHKYNMAIYMVTLNSKDMTDTVLINLLSSVPRRSVVMIDEIDKQLDAVRRNHTASVSTGGLLTALDGPQRLSEGSIVILTANRRYILPAAEMQSLLRAGRIDKVVEFS